ncbi:MAG: PaaI family thioesterase [bacterium]|nr:PaaI family thioesterase [bacterium]
MDEAHSQVESSSGLSQACHPSCLVCRGEHEGGLGLRFEAEADGSVVGHFACDASYQGYPDRLHGGVVSMLLDAAMTNCLFLQKIRAVTAKLSVRFRHPVRLGVDAVVRARIKETTPPLYILQAELVQEEETCARAEATFFADDSRGKRSG